MKTQYIKQIIKEELSKILFEKKSSSTVYKFKGILSVDSKKRNKEEVLSDIRSLTGVTIVSTKPAQHRRISIKY